MPRCGTEQFVSNPATGITPGTVDLETPDGDVRVMGARIVSVTRGEWHPIRRRGTHIGMETGTSLYYPAMDIVICWEPGGQVSWVDPIATRPAPVHKVFLPDGVTIDTAALDGLRMQFGFSTSEMGVYSSIINASTVTGHTPNWVAYSCFMGDTKITCDSTNGDPLTEVIMTKTDRSTLKGGWVFAKPDAPPSSSREPGSHWINLSATRFAILGAPYGALFGSGREFYYECGLEEDAAQLAAIRAEFGFGPTEGRCAYIKVYDDINNYLINVEPE